MWLVDWFVSIIRRIFGSADLSTHKLSSGHSRDLEAANRDVDDLLGQGDSSEISKRFDDELDKAVKAPLIDWEKKVIITFWRASNSCYFNPAYNYAMKEKKVAISHQSVDVWRPKWNEFLAALESYLENHGSKVVEDINLKKDTRRKKLREACIFLESLDKECQEVIDIVEESVIDMVDNPGLKNSGHFCPADDDESHRAWLVLDQLRLKLEKVSKSLKVVYE